jgi:hypothetical protein
LDKVADPVLRSLLLRIQQSFNAALANEKQNVAGHVNHPPFYLDYIDSSVPNALAFRYEAQDHYSFIGITIPLINLLWDLCVRLSRSEAIQILIRLSLKIEEYDALQIVLFLAMSSFIVSHEYTHHVHGHLSGGGADAALFNEILDDGDSGSLEVQAVEVDADRYAAYHVLANMIDGTARSAVELLKIGAEPANAQDEVLLSCFVIAVGGYPSRSCIGQRQRLSVLASTPSRQDELPDAGGHGVVPAKPAGPRNLDDVKSISNAHERFGDCCLGRGRRRDLG